MGFLLEYLVLLICNIGRSMQFLKSKKNESNFSFCIFLLVLSQVLWLVNQYFCRNSCIKFEKYVLFSPKLSLVYYE